jgi:hypothetical protein
VIGKAASQLKRIKKNNSKVASSNQREKLYEH